MSSVNFVGVYTLVLATVHVCDFSVNTAIIIHVCRFVLMGYQHHWVL